MDTTTDAPMLVRFVGKIWSGMSPIDGYQPPSTVVITEHQPVPENARRIEADSPATSCWLINRSGIQPMRPEEGQRLYQDSVEASRTVAGRRSPYVDVARANFAPVEGSDDFLLRVLWGPRYGRSDIVRCDGDAVTIVKRLTIA